MRMSAVSFVLAGSMALGLGGCATGARDGGGVASDQFEAAEAADGQCLHLATHSASNWELYERQGDVAFDGPGHEMNPCTMVEEDAQVTELADLLHHKAWSKLVTACLALNHGEVDIPNSAAASELIGTSEQT